jgi:hypothetical protein
MRGALVFQPRESTFSMIRQRWKVDVYWKRYSSVEFLMNTAQLIEIRFVCEQVRAEHLQQQRD